MENFLDSKQVVALIRERLAGLNQRQIAKKLGVSQAYLSRVLTGQDIASGRLAESMGLERVTLYRCKKAA